jgi:hypothetical protein
MSYKTRRWSLSAVVVSFALGLAFVSGVVVGAAKIINKPHPRTAFSILAQGVSLKGVQQVPVQHLKEKTAAQIPVLVYHEMNNGCKASAVICKSPDYETVSSAQFQQEMQWVYSQGYHTVTLPQYLAWLSNPHMLLPSKPFFITVDNGIGNFLQGAEPTLYHFRFKATAFLITGFAYGADGICEPPLEVDHKSYDVQPGCYKLNVGWDLTWAEIKTLSPAVYGFGIEAGESGHFVQTYNPECYAFAACKIPGETTAEYEGRVEREISKGVTVLRQQLGPRFDADGWVVPYSDLGYFCSRIAGCAYEHHTGPAGWLTGWAGSHFQAVFVQDAYRNGIRNERYRFEVHALDTIKEFATGIEDGLKMKAFTREESK